MTLRLSPSEIKLLEPRFKMLEEAPIVMNSDLPNASVLGWLSTAFTSEGIPLGGGCSSTRILARKIALIETLERAAFQQLRSLPDSEQDFGLQSFPSTCGFAAGFDLQQTRFRSLCEAVERWARAKWIDDQCRLDEVPPPQIELSLMAEYFRSGFHEVRFFSRNFKVDLRDRSESISLRLGVVIGLIDGGIFPGSQVCSLTESPWEHSLLEAWRHLQIFQNNKSKKLPERSFIPRIVFFGNNAEEGLRQIAAGTRMDWPRPQLMLHKSISMLSDKLKVSRSLCSGYSSWNEGGIDRFVY